LTEDNLVDLTSFCHIIEFVKKNKVMKELGASRMHHSDFTMNDNVIDKLKCKNDNIKSVVKKLKRDIHIKTSSFGITSPYEKNFYKKLTINVFMFNTPHIITLIADCGPDIITEKGGMELIRLIQWRSRLDSQTYITFRHFPFTQELYTSVIDAINKIKRNDDDMFDMAVIGEEKAVYEKFLGKSHYKTEGYELISNFDMDEIQTIAENFFRMPYPPKIFDNLTMQQFMDYFDEQLLEYEKRYQYYYISSDIYTKYI